MSFSICVDASFALKLVLQEEDSDAVHALWTTWVAQDAEICAPCHLMIEAISVIRNHVYRRNISPAAEQAAVEALWAQEIELLHPGFIERRAWELAQQFKRPTVYDALYLAVAEHIGCELWTADDRLYKAVHDALPWVRSLRG